MAGKEWLAAGLMHYWWASLINWKYPPHQGSVCVCMWADACEVSGFILCEQLNQLMCSPVFLIGMQHGNSLPMFAGWEIINTDIARYNMPKSKVQVIAIIFDTLQKVGWFERWRPPALVSLHLGYRLSGVNKRWSCQEISNQTKAN